MNRMKTLKEFLRKRKAIGHADLAFVQEDFSLHHAFRASNGLWRTDIEIASGGWVRSKN